MAADGRLAREPKGNPLMTERLYLHVGAPKSGTTYLQQVLELNRPALAAAGMLVVGERHLDRIHAAMVVREDPRLAKLPRRAQEAWTRLVSQIRAWEGSTAVLSYELFAGASADQVRRALADLDGLEVHVVITARDLAAAVPSAWQERLKFALTTPLEEWKPRPESAGPRAEWGWRTLDPAGVARRWGADLPPDRVHVVTVPRRGSRPELLWERFSEALGLDVPGLDLKPQRSNESLGVAAAELLRRVNVALADRLPGNREQAVWIRDTLAHGVLAGLGGDRIGLTEAQYADALARSEKAIAELRAAGYAVHGDLDEIAATRGEERTPGQATDAEVAAAGAAAVAELLLLLRERTRERDEALGATLDDESAGLLTKGKRLVRNATSVAVRKEHDRLAARVEALEAELHRTRRLQLRVAELTDLVTELLLPADQQDSGLVEERLAAYREGVL